MISSMNLSKDDTGAEAGLDIRNLVLSFAVQAASPHNTQPWKVRFTGNDRIMLYIDRERLLPCIDPMSRQAFISQGAFLENLDLAAGAHGYRADIDLFPGGWPDPVKVPDTPVATVDLIHDARVREDPLFHQIPLRHTNRRKFRRTTVPLPIAGELTAAYDYSLVPLGFSNDPGLAGFLGETAVSAMEVEMAGKERLEETLLHFRFTDREVDEHRDGLGLAQSGYGVLSRLLIGKFVLSRKRAENSPGFFAGMLTKSIRSQVRNAGGIGWLSTRSNHRIEQVRAGRAYQRVHLKATSLGLALQPFSQVISDYPDMDHLRSRLYEYLGIPDTHTIQMLFRLGYASPVPAAPRRDLMTFHKAGP